MHDIENLSAILGLTPSQVRRRLADLDDLLRDHIKQGKRNKIIVDDAGLEILRRVTEYEKQGLSLSECKAIIKEELDSGQISLLRTEDLEGDKVEQTSMKLLEILREQLQEKDRQIKVLQEQINRLHEIIQERLPPLPPSPASVEARAEGEKRVGRWKRLKQLIRGE